MELNIKTGSHFYSGLNTEEHVRISISRSDPKQMPEPPLRISELKPGHWFKSVSVERYAEHYLQQLENLGIERVMAGPTKLQGYYPDKTIVLLCWEGQGDHGNWCHRGLLANWLFVRAGLKVTELDDDRFGKAHPKIPAALKGKGVTVKVRKMI